MKNKTLLTIVYDFKSGEGKKKFIEGLNYLNKINSHSQNKILLDLSNFCSGKDFQFDNLVIMDINRVKLCTTLCTW